jgi:hypothetical protein
MADKENNEKRAKALQASYATTTAWLIEQHREEFDTHRAALLKDQGIDWSPKKTQEQKDAELLEEIRRRSPALFDLPDLPDGKPFEPLPTDPTVQRLGDKSL